MTERSGRDFGDPAGVRQMAQAARQTATDLTSLTETVTRDVRATVPDLWGGDTATAFQQSMYRFSRSVAGLASPVDQYAKRLDTAADTMELARLHLDEAQRFASQNGLRIREDLVVERAAGTPDRTDLAAVMTTAQQGVDRAWLLAKDAQTQVRHANQVLNQAAVDAAANFAQISGPMARRAARRPGLTPKHKARKDRNAAWQRMEELAARRKARDWARAQNQRHPEYRKQVTDVRGFPPSGDIYVAHHQFPVGLTGQFRAIGIETSNPSWGTWARARDHEAFTPEHYRRWQQFFADNPGTDPKVMYDKAFDLARQMAKDYGYPH